MKKKILKTVLTVVSICAALALSALALHLFNNWRVEFVSPPPERVEIECFSDFEAPEVKAVLRGDLFFKDGVEADVTRTGEVDASRLGEYTLRWTAEKIDLSASVGMTVAVVDTTPPEITLVPEEREYVLPTGTYDDPGFSALDAVDGDITDRVRVELTDESAIYTVSDLSGNETTVTRPIPFDDPIPPEIKLKGKKEITFYAVAEKYKEPGFTATDNLDGDITDKVKVSGKVDDKTPGTYTIKYTVEDSYKKNKAEAKRTVIVKEAPPPAISLAGSAEISVAEGGSYAEPGYSASHELEGDITDRVKVSGSVDTSTPGSYTLTYTVKDSYGHTATATRTVTVYRVPKPQPPVDQSAPLPSGTKTIYLTFDDGPSANTARLLQILAKYNVKATFFVVGYGYENMIGEEYRAGHSIAVHSLTHDYRTIYASEAAYFADLEAMNEIVRRQTGQTTSLIRFPGGSSNSVSSFNPGIMTRLTAAVTEAGYTYFDWNVSSGDAGQTTSADVVYQNVVNGIAGKTSAVVLQHDSKSYSVDAVERIIIWGLDNGYTFLPLTASSPTCHHHVNN